MSSRLITENDLKAILESMPSKNIAGEIKTYAGIVVPDGWLECDGSEVLIEDFPLLAAALGANHPDPNDPDYMLPPWGAPTEGYEYFKLPDLRGRSPIGVGLGTASDATNRILGQTGGSERVTLKTNQLPSHTHNYQKPVLMYGTGGNAAWPGAGSNSKGSDQWGYYTTESTGGDESHGNMPPYATIHYIICAI